MYYYIFSKLYIIHILFSNMATTGTKRISASSKTDSRRIAETDDEKILRRRIMVRQGEEWFYKMFSSGFGTLEDDVREMMRFFNTTSLFDAVFMCVSNKDNMRMYNYRLSSEKFDRIINSVLMFLKSNGITESSVKKMMGKSRRN